VITNIHKVDEITQSPLCFHSNFTANLPLQCSFDVIFLHTLSTMGMFFMTSFVDSYVWRYNLMLRYMIN